MTSSTVDGVLFKAACGDWVVVQEDPMPASSKGGIVYTRGGIVEMRKEVSTGKVICVGRGAQLANGEHRRAPCGGGDRVLFSRYALRVIEEGDEGDLVAVKFEEIVGVIA